MRIAAVAASALASCFSVPVPTADDLPRVLDIAPKIEAGACTDSRFEVGQVVQGFVRNVWRSFAFIDIGAERDARLELSELDDGFPGKSLKAVLYEHHTVRSRVLEVAAGGAIWLTRRSGSLTRPPRIQKEDENRAPEALQSLPSDIWLDGQVGDFLPTGVFVHVRDPEDGQPQPKKPLVGFLPAFLFLPGFEKEAIRGKRIKVKKEGFNPGKGLLLTMRQT
eukprot:s1906_g15.t1